MAKVLNRINSDSTPSSYRFERKFVYTDLKVEEVLESMVMNNPFFFNEVFERRTINNIYFDDANHSFYKMNVSGIGYRSKYRLRWYGDEFNLVSNPAIEIKKKFGDVGDKVLYKLPKLAIDISSKSIDEVYHKIISEIKDKQLLSILQRLFPTLYNSYERRYFISADEKFRITLDYHMKFFEPNVDQFMITQVEDPNVILELKYATEYDDKGRNLSQFLGERLSKNSKYIIGYDLLRNQ